MLNSSRKGCISAGRMKVFGTKSYWPGAAACIRFMFLARSFLRQISSMPTKWLIFCGQGARFAGRRGVRKEARWWCVRGGDGPPRLRAVEAHDPVAGDARVRPVHMPLVVVTDLRVNRPRRGGVGVSRKAGNSRPAAALSRAAKQEKRQPRARRSRSGAGNQAPRLLPAEGVEDSAEDLHEVSGPGRWERTSSDQSTANRANAKGSFPPIACSS